MKRGYVGNLLWNWATWLGVGFLVLAGSWVASGFMAGEEPGSGEAERSHAQQNGEDFGSPVWALAVSSGGTYLGWATVGGDVWIKELPGSRSFRMERGTMGSARSLAISPDGRVLAVAGIKASVRLWDVDEGRMLDSLEVEGDVAKTVTFAPAGRLLAVGEWSSPDHGAVSLWDWRDRRPCRVLEGHHGGINAMAFSADAALLASGDSTGVVKLWDVAAGRERSSLAAYPPGTAIVAMAFSPDGARLATAGLYVPLVHLWDAWSGRLLGTVPGTQSGVNGLAFSPDGKMLAVARQDGTAAIWGDSGSRELGAIGSRDAGLKAVIFTADGRMLATGGVDGCLRLWDIAQALGGAPRTAGL